MSFTDAIESFARDLTANFALPVPAGPEDQLKEPMKVLLRAAGTVFACTIESRTEAHGLDSGGRPDVGVTRDGLLCGHIELKAPGKGARPNQRDFPEGSRQDPRQGVANPGPCILSPPCY